MAEANDRIGDEAALTERLTAPTTATRTAVAALDGDVLVLGAGGKMGPNLVELLVRAGGRRVIAVSRFSDASHRDYLERVGADTVVADLLEEEAMSALPDAANVFILAGYKFGSTANEAATWATNALLPANAVARFRHSRIVYLSSGNVYPFTPVDGQGSSETDDPAPVGEYAQSRLGGDRLVAFKSATTGAAVVTVRLFYATELRYGIIHDVVTKVAREQVIDLSMGHVNQIWQGDALNYMAQMFPLCASPAAVINLTGPEILRIRSIAAQAGALLGKEPVFTGVESETALLGNCAKLVELYGQPETAPDRIIEWMVEWVKEGGRSLGKPTGYEKRTGKF